MDLSDLLTVSDVRSILEHIDDDAASVMSEAASEMNALRRECAQAREERAAAQGTLLLCTMVLRGTTVYRSWRFDLQRAVRLNMQSCS